MATTAIPASLATTNGIIGSVLEQHLLLLVVELKGLIVVMPCSWVGIGNNTYRLLITRYWSRWRPLLPAIQKQLMLR